MPSSQMLDYVNPEQMPRPNGYTQVVTLPPKTRLILISGQIGMRKDGTLVDGGFGPQARKAFENVATALAAIGTDFAYVVKLSMFVTDFDEQLAELREVRDSFVNVAAPPASTTIEVPRLFVKGALFEVDVVAVMPEKPT